MKSDSPLCNNTEVSLIQSYSSKELVDGWMKAYGIDISNELKDIDNIKKYRCSTSGLIFYLPKGCTGSWELYKSLGKIDWYYQSEKWEYSIATSFCNSNDRILEVGCGNGEYLKKLTLLKCLPTGLEINPDAIASGIADGLNILNQTISEFKKTSSEYFDVVCAFQVLEHLPEPVAFINDCISVIKTGGKVIFGTPNSESFLKHSHNLLDLPPHHMSGWNETSYKYLAKIFNLDLIETHYEPLASYHVDYYIETMRVSLTNSRIMKIALNLPCIPAIMKTILKLGFRKFVKGQSMVAVFQKR